MADKNEKKQPEERTSKPRRKERKRSVHGGGSVYQRRSEGKERWVATMKDPESGKRQERYAKSEKEAYGLLEQMKGEIKQGTLVTALHRTVEKYLQDWFENVQKQAVRNTTYLKQESILNKAILPTIGHIQLQKLYSEKLSAGWKASSVRNIHKYCIRLLTMRCAGNLSPATCVIWCHCHVKCGISRKC